MSQHFPFEIVDKIQFGTLFFLMLMTLLSPGYFEPLASSYLDTLRILVSPVNIDMLRCLPSGPILFSTFIIRLVMSQGFKYQLVFL